MRIVLYLCFCKCIY